MTDTPILSVLEAMCGGHFRLLEYKNIEILKKNIALGPFLWKRSHLLFNIQLRALGICSGMAGDYQRFKVDAVKCCQESVCCYCRKRTSPNPTSKALLKILIPSKGGIEMIENCVWEEEVLQIQGGC